MTQQKRERDCGSCLCFRPHDTYSYFGVCSTEDKLMVRAAHVGVCERFRELSAGELRKALLARGWLYCLSCSTPIFTVEELEQHLRHVLGLDFCDDEVAGEEAPPAS